MDSNFELISRHNSKSVYKDNERVIKVFEEGYTKNSILQEAYNQSIIETSDINAPKVLQVTSIDNKWAIISEYIPGKTLQTLMNENPEKFDEYLDLFVDIQIKVLWGQLDIPLRKLKDKMKNKINKSDFDSAIKYELNARIEATPNHQRICHGNFNPMNIILREGDNTPFVLDWFHVTQGNASADAARTYLLFCIDDTKEHAEKYLTKFCEKTNTDRAYVERWIPVVAATQYMKNINNENEKNILESWINVAEY